MTDTIYALSSGAGRAAVAVIRISGPAARTVWASMLTLDIIPRRARYAIVRDPGSGEALDRALALFFAAPNTFTGEDVIELHTHGSRAVIQGVLQALASLESVRIAEPGEFTRRAFENGKLSLSSAEGLADLIEADTALQRRQALLQIDNSIAQTAGAWRGQILSAIALVEAQIDFPDEEDAPADVTDDVQSIISALSTQLRLSISSRKAVEIVREGYVVLIAGPPNAGKSTLLNVLAQRDVAITSAIPGTTRDLIEVKLDLDGVPVVLVDTAGVRETDDPLELIGIERAMKRAEQANLVLWLSPAGAQEILPPETLASKAVVVRTKCDLDPGLGFARSLVISAAEAVGIDELLSLVRNKAAEGLGNAHEGLILKERHMAAAGELLDCLDRASRTLVTHQLELTAEDLRRAGSVVSRLSEEIVVDDVLDEIFSRFCLGK